MPSMCAVVECNNRQSKYSKLSFYCFPTVKRKNAVKDELPLFCITIVMVQLWNLAIETVFVHNISLRARRQTCTPTRTMCYQFTLRICQIVNVMQLSHFEYAIHRAKLQMGQKRQ